MREYQIKGTDYYLRYHDFPGEKETILFIHGLGCAGSFDYPQVAVQPEIEKYRKIIVDLLGSGYSDKPKDFSYTVNAHADYLLEFIEELNIENIILFGHSLGGAVALSLADKCRDRLKCILLSEGNLDKSKKGSASFKIGHISEVDFVKNWFEIMIRKSIKYNNQLWAATLSVCSPEAISRISKSAVEGVSPSWREILYSLKCSKTYIYGENSLPDANMEELLEKGVSIEVVEKAGHSMATENPRGLAAAIKNGLKKL